MERICRAVDSFNVQVREDVVTGVRLGSILLALLLACFTGYRMFHDAAPAHRAAPQTKAAPAAPVAPPVPIHVDPAPVTAAPVPPPPPPLVHKAIRRKTLSTPESLGSTRGETNQSGVAPEAPVQEETPKAALADLTAERAVPLPVAEPIVSPAAVAQPVEEPESTKAPGRGKRMLKTVGRWLHIGTPAEAVRQP